MHLDLYLFLSLSFFSVVGMKPVRSASRVLFMLKGVCTVSPFRLGGFIDTIRSPLLPFAFVLVLKSEFDHYFLRLITLFFLS